jgi:hypothetical protein
MHGISRVGVTTSTRKLRVRVRDVYCTRIIIRVAMWGMVRVCGIAQVIRSAVGVRRIASAGVVSRISEIKRSIVAVHLA